jgi:Na+-driven multidrug efflux pump
LASCGAGLALSGLIPFLVVPLFGTQFSGAIWPGVILALAAAIAASNNVLNQGLRGAGRPQAGVLSQLIGIVVVAVTVLFFLRGLGLTGMAFGVLLGAGAQALALVGAAAKWFGVSALEFWPFDASNFRSFFQLVSNLRLRSLRSPA